MKAWRSLRVRLIFSYVALALLLLTFAGYVFSNALSIYAVAVQGAQTDLYMKQAFTALAEARSRNLSGPDTLALLRQNLPNVRVEMVTVPPDRSIRPIFGGGPVIIPGQEPGTIQAQPFVHQETFPGATRLLVKTPVPRTQIGFTASSKGSEISFTVPAPTVTNGVPSTTAYQFTLTPSGFALLSNLLRQVLEVLVLALLLSGLIGWLLSRWLSRPLSRLAAATEAVAGGNFLETVERSGVVELDRLGEQFNRMVLYLRESFRSLAAERDTAQRFAADAAHELKTPVATLRAYHDVINEHPERLAQVTPAVGRQIERMEQVITGLLQISNLGGGSGITLEPADLGAAVRGLEPVYEALAAESGLQLTISTPADPVPCRIDRRLLELALNNLMDNACKYTEPGGQVELSLGVNDDNALITVRDSGQGIDPAELPYIFDRFHRGVATQSIPGTGLGLAIAREAVQRLGGQLTAESEPGKGSRFLIRLPLERSP